MSNDSLLAQWADEYGVAHLKTVNSGVFDPSLIETIPVTWAREQCVLPIRLDGVPTLLMSGPEGLTSLQQATVATGVEFQPAFSEKETILAAIDAAYYAGKRTQSEVTRSEASMTSAESRKAGIASSTVLDLQVTQGGESGGFRGGVPIQVEKGTAAIDLLIETSEPASRFWNNAILEAVRRGASDIHLEPMDDGISRLRFRISGRLYEQPTPSIGLTEQLVSRIKVMAAMDIAEHRLPQDGMAQVKIGDRAIDLRVSTIPVAGGERVVARLLQQDDSLLPLSELGMTGKVFEEFSGMLSLPNGIVVVSGPTGSGKTTTLYSALRTLDADHRNIMTIEDPIEYRLDRIAQIQVKPKIGLTFAAGLRTILRQDPDVVLVGETRDSETAEIAVRAALTGHLVFTTLHTNDAPSAVPRFLDMGIEPFLLSSCLRGVLSQRLVRRVCPQCSERISLKDVTDIAMAELEVARHATCDTIQRVHGCSHCLEGYCGRIGIFELLACRGSVSEAIHDGTPSATDLRDIAIRSGLFCDMASDAIEKLRAGITTPAEIVTALGTLTKPAG
ncbi:MAG: GspE/PulE family protein [Kiritimatiellia bacterium]